eukprot:1157461-Pelagomonas_calceolata.AAC.5
MCTGHGNRDVLKDLCKNWPDFCICAELAAPQWLLNTWLLQPFALLFIVLARSATKSIHAAKEPWLTCHLMLNAWP